MFKCKLLHPNPLLGINLFIITNEMKRIWHNYKIWIVICIAYLGFYSFKGFKKVASLLFSFQK